jgi:hypothetical protein
MARAAIPCRKSEIGVSLPYEQFNALACQNRSGPHPGLLTQGKNGEEKSFELYPA